MGRRRFDRSRRGAVREAHKRFAYAAEGKVTEPEYFSGLLRSRHISPELVKYVKSSDNDPLNIVNAAVQAKKKNARKVRVGDEALIDEWWAVIDTEGPRHPHGNLDKALACARKNNVHVALSDPCFELWLLLRYRFTTRAFLDAHEVIAALAGSIPGYSEKNKHLSDEGIFGRIEEALANAERLRRHNEEIGTASPMTDVDMFVRSVFEAERGAAAQ